MRHKCTYGLSSLPPTKENSKPTSGENSLISKYQCFICSWSVMAFHTSSLEVFKCCSKVTCPGFMGIDLMAVQPYFILINLKIITSFWPSCNTDTYEYGINNDWQV